MDHKTKTLIDGMIATAKSRYEGFGTPEKRSTKYENGKFCMSPEAYHMLTHKEGYIFLYPFPAASETVLAYYLKKSEYFSEGSNNKFATPVVDADHHVYCFAYLRDKNTGDLALREGGVKLSGKKAKMILREWCDIMDNMRKG